MSMITESAPALRDMPAAELDAALDKIDTRYMEIWQAEAGLKTYGQAVADVMEFRTAEGERFDMSVEKWLAFSNRASFYEVRERAKSMGIQVVWDCELPKTPEGFYHIQGGIDYAIAKSLAVAPFADLLWMETKTADLEDARKFAHAIHAQYPDKMLAYNLSPSFSWDTTGMSDEEMKRFPEELGKLGFVFNFITYGGHQIDGMAAEEFATALKQDGMLALARLQRKFRLLESPYRTPQTLVGGPRLDAALMASSGRTAATKAMGKGSTQFQHLVQTEVPTKLLEEWLAEWSKHWDYPAKIRVQLRPHTAGSELLELSVLANRAVQRGKARQRYLCLHPGSSRPEHPLGSRPEYPGAASQEATDDARPTVSDPPLQCQLGALRHSNRGQRISDTEDEESGDFLGRGYRDWANHRRASQQRTRCRTAQA